MRIKNGSHGSCSIFRYFSALAASLCLTAPAHAVFLASLNSVGYNGSWEKFASLPDAQNAINAVDSGLVPQRDLQLYLSQGRSTTDAFQFVTWHHPLDDNPSNTNEGFVQISDFGLNTVDSLTGGWTDSNFDTYQINLSGSNALGQIGEGPGAIVNQATRLGVGPSDRITNGDWLSYDLTLNFGGLSSSETSPGIQRAQDDPSLVSGNLFVLFESPSLLDLDDNPNANLGFYRVDISINSVSWAVDNNVPAVVDTPGLFEAATTPIPEPSTFAFAVAIFAATSVFSRRRR